MAVGLGRAAARWRCLRRRAAGGGARLLPWVWRGAGRRGVAAGDLRLLLPRPAGRLAEHDAIALRSFAWYVMPLGLAAAVVGYVAALRRFAARDSVFLLTFSLYASFFFYKIRIVPEHYWMTRRFLPMILPGALLLAAYAAFGRWRERRSRPALSARAAAPSAWSSSLCSPCMFWRASAPLFGHVEYAGVDPAAREARRGRSATRTWSSSNRATPRTSTCWPCRWPTSTPATCCCCRTAGPTRRRWSVHRLGATAVRHRLLRRRRRHRAAVASDRASSRSPPRSSRCPSGHSARNALPAATGARSSTSASTASRPPATPAGGVALDVGVNDDVNVLRFHAKERTPTAPPSAGRATCPTSTCRA